MVVVGNAVVPRIVGSLQVSRRRAALGDVSRRLRRAWRLPRAEDAAHPARLARAAMPEPRPARTRRPMRSRALRRAHGQVAAVRGMTDLESRSRLLHRLKSGLGASLAVEDLPGGADRWLGRRCRHPRATTHSTLTSPVTCCHRPVATPRHPHVAFSADAQLAARLAARD